MVVDEVLKGDIVWITSPLDFYSFSKDKKKSKGQKVNVEGMQEKERPAIIVQCDIGNAFSPTTKVILGTTVIKKEEQRTHFVIEGCGLGEPTMFMAEQEYTIPMDYIQYKIGSLKREQLKILDFALAVSHDYEGIMGYVKSLLSKEDKLEDKLISGLYIPDTGKSQEILFINNLIEKFPVLEGRDKNDIAKLYLFAKMDELFKGVKDGSVNQSDYIDLMWYINQAMLVMTGNADN